MDKLTAGRHCNIKEVFAVLCFVPTPTANLQLGRQSFLDVTSYRCAVPHWWHSVSAGCRKLWYPCFSQWQR